MTERGNRFPETKLQIGAESPTSSKGERPVYELRQEPEGEHNQTQKLEIDFRTLEEKKIILGRHITDNGIYPPNTQLSSEKKHRPDGVLVDVSHGRPGKDRNDGVSRRHAELHLVERTSEPGQYDLVWHQTGEVNPSLYCEGTEGPDSIDYKPEQILKAQEERVIPGNNGLFFLAAPIGNKDQAALKFNRIDIDASGQPTNGMVWEIERVSPAIVIGNQESTIVPGVEGLVTATITMPKPSTLTQ